MGRRRNRLHSRQRWVASVVSMGLALIAYAFLSSVHRWIDLSRLPHWLGRALQPEALPSLLRLLQTLILLVSGGGGESGLPVHGTDHLWVLLERRVTLQGALAQTVARVLVGLGTGALLGIFAGLAMGWSRRVDEYVHPVFILLRSIPPLALISYLMLWLGHGEAHLVLPATYAVFTVMAIASYHGIRDIPAVYLMASAALGIRGGLLWRRVILPATVPAILSGVRYALMVAWMTVVGAEMLMADNGIGHLVVGGGLWSSRMQLGVDPAVVIVGIIGLATAGYVMDRGTRALGEVLTSWAHR